jgi:hypothetical protein
VLDEAERALVDEQLRHVQDNAELLWRLLYHDEMGRAQVCATVEGVIVEKDIGDISLSKEVVRGKCEAHRGTKDIVSGGDDVPSILDTF